jgi:hypothetical protein
MLFVVAATALVSSAAAAKPMTVQQREAAWLQSIKAQQIDVVAGYLAPTYVGVYEDGIHDKARELEFVRGQTIRNIRMSNFSARTTPGGEVLLTYLLEVRGNKGRMNFTGRYWATSLWHRTGNSWTIVYHSDVKAK